jgi:plastocyanin
VAVCRSAMRVLVAVVVVAAGGIAWAEVVGAAGKEITATGDPAKCDKTWGPPCFAPSNGTVTQINQGDTITWKALDGTHTVSPADGTSFAGSGDLTGPDGTFSVTFDKPGTYSFYCKHHGSVEDGGKIHHGMWGKIEVKADDTTNTTAAPAPPPGSQPPPPNPDPGAPPPPGPTRPPSPPPSSSPPPNTSNGSGANGQGGSGQTAAGTGRPFVGPPPTQTAPPPTRAAFSGPPPTQPPTTTKGKDKEKEGGDSAAPPEATVLPPDEAVLPPSPQFPTSTTAPLAVAPGEVPHGDTIAVLKNEAGGRRRKLVLFVTVFGVGAFAAGVGGWKYVNRSSKYWPA